MSDTATEGGARLSKDPHIYATLVGAITDYAIFMLDPEGRVSTWNPGAQRSKGYTEAEILGEHFSRFYTDEDRAAGLPQRALALAREEGRFETEGWRVRKDGGRFWAHVVIDPIRNEQGDLVGYAKISRDLSERRRSAESLAESEERFRLLVEGIADYAIYMLDPKGRISSWNAGAQRFKGYVAEEVLGEHFSRFYTPEDLASGMPARVLATAEREGRFESEGWRVRKDGSRFWAQATEDSLPDRNAQDLPAGDYVRIFVTDTGSGMDSETLARAVEPFYTTKGVGRGTGLGLPMVHGVAAQSGGRLILKSAKGEGTTAEIWLPRDPSGRVFRPRGVERQGEPGVAAKALTILVVDDDPLVLRNTAVALEDAGHEPIEASSGQAALDMLEGKPEVEIVVTDYLMPGMNGLQLAEKIRAQRPDLPVLIASAYGDLSSSGLKLPKLQKPFTQHELLQAISAAMNERSRDEGNVHILRQRDRLHP